MPEQALQKVGLRYHHSPQCHGKPCKGVYDQPAICDHPLGNNIEFHPNYRESQRFGFIWTRECDCYTLISHSHWDDYGNQQQNKPKHKG